MLDSSSEFSHEHCKSTLLALCKSTSDFDTEATQLTMFNKVAGASGYGQQDDEEYARFMVAVQRFTGEVCQTDNLHSVTKTGSTYTPYRTRLLPVHHHKH
jgi:hypothetical protein